MEMFTMKKVLSIVLALFLLLSATCFAAYEPDPARWTLLPGYQSCYYDKTTAQFSEDGNTVEFWICLVDNEEHTNFLRKYRMTKVPRTSTELELESYNNLTDKKTGSRVYPPQEQFIKNIYANSPEEDLYCAIFSVQYPTTTAERMHLIGAAKSGTPYLLDTATIQYRDNGNQADCWLIIVSDGQISWTNLLINKIDKTVTSLYSFVNSTRDSDIELRFRYVPDDIYQLHKDDKRYKPLETRAIPENSIMGDLYQYLFSK